MTGQLNNRRILLLENPKSGAGAGAQALSALLRRQGAQLTVRVLEADVACERYLRDLREFDTLVVAGGDGTVSSVSYAARGSGVPMLICPAGTANLVAQNLQLPSSPEALLGVLRRGQVVTTDLGELEVSDQLYGFAMLAGAGLDAEIIRGSEDLKAKLGALSYLVSGFKQLSPTQTRFILDLDGRRIETEGLSVLIANFGRLNFRLPIAAGIDPADGQLSVLIVKGQHVVSLLPHLLGALSVKLGLRAPAPHRNLERYTCAQVRVEADHALPLEYDGELLKASLPMTLRVLPGAALFLTDLTPGVLTT